MELVSNLLSQFGHLEIVAGECPTHGPQSVYCFPGKSGWYCPTCMEATRAEEQRVRWETERTAHLHNIAAIPHKYRGQRFTASTAAHKKMRGTVKAYRDFLLTERSWAALVLVGPVGTGKTLLACELAESLIGNFGWSVRYVTAKGMIGEIQASYNTDGKSEEGEIIRFVQYEVLILDEIDAKATTPNANVLLTEIINRRYNAGRPVVAISNQAFDTLGEFVGDRVHDRLYENLFLCAFDWPSFRRKP